MEARVGAAAPASGPAVQAAGAMADNVASALCYVLGLITGIIFLVLAPYNRNPAIRFHAFQSIFLNVACIVAMHWAEYRAVDASTSGDSSSWLILAGYLSCFGSTC